MSRLHLDSHSGTRLPLAYFCYICVPDSFTWISSVSPRTPTQTSRAETIFPTSSVGMFGAPDQQAGHSESQEAVGREDSQPSHGQRLYLGKGLNTSYCCSQVQKRGTDDFLPKCFFEYPEQKFL